MVYEVESVYNEEFVLLCKLVQSNIHLAHVKLLGDECQNLSYSIDTGEETNATEKKIYIYNRDW